MSDKTLYWPRGSITQRANSMTLNLPCQFINHVNLSIVGFTNQKPLHYIDQPSGPFSTRSALTTALVLVKLAQSQDRIDNISALVHHNNCSRSKPTLDVPKGIKVH